MSLSRSTIEYLRRVANLETDITPWRAWCDTHRDELEAWLTRTGFLRLKFSPREALPPLLQQLGISFGSDALQLHLAQPELGWRASPRDIYGIRELYDRGRHREADAVVMHAVAEIAESADAFRGRILGDLMMDAELMHRCGWRRYARAIARAIADLPRHDDLVVAAIDHARAFISQIEGTGGTDLGS